MFHEMPVRPSSLSRLLSIYPFSAPSSFDLRCFDSRAFWQAKHVEHKQTVLIPQLAKAPDNAPLKPVSLLYSMGMLTLN
jgi:hypothetical protein